MLLLIVLYIMFDASLWVYLVHQAKGQLSIIFHTQKIEKVIAEKSLTQSQLNKIKLIGEVKLYAQQHFGLKKTNNYQTYYDQQNKPILWILTACEPFSFKEKVWNFPLLGEVSYKGFFDYTLASAEAIPLKMKHYDVDIGKVSAWSTLGFLSDPILSSMLEHDEGELAELIIHELTHATLYFPNEVDFNENFASFVGKQGALEFIEYKYGKESKQMKSYLEEIEMETALKGYMLRQKELLEVYYKSLNDNLTFNQKVALKQQKMDEIISALYFLNTYKWKTKIKIAQKIKISGNAYFMSFNRYDAQYNHLLAIYHKQNSNLKSFITYAKENMTKDELIH